MPLTVETGKLKPREVKSPAQGHTASGGQSLTQPVKNGGQEGPREGALGWARPHVQ